MNLVLRDKYRLTIQKSQISILLLYIYLHNMINLYYLINIKYIHISTHSKDNDFNLQINIEPKMRKILKKREKSK